MVIYSLGVTGAARLSLDSLDVPSSPRMGWSDGPPVEGYWKAGDLLWNEAATSDFNVPSGWRCVREGSPGTWLPTGGSSGAPIYTGEIINTSNSDLSIELNGTYSAHSDLNVYALRKTNIGPPPTPLDYLTTSRISIYAVDAIGDPSLAGALIGTKESIAGVAITRFGLVNGDGDIAVAYEQRSNVSGSILTLGQVGVKVHIDGFSVRMPASNTTGSEEAEFWYNNITHRFEYRDDVSTKIIATGQNGAASVNADGTHVKSGCVYDVAKTATGTYSASVNVAWGTPDNFVINAHIVGDIVGSTIHMVKTTSTVTFFTRTNGVLGDLPFNFTATDNRS